MARIVDIDFANSFVTQEREEESRLRSLLETSPQDFDVWLELIKQVEKYKSNEKSKAIYQDFLQEFPQYFPVWRKLAEVYSSEKNTEMVVCTFEEGLKYIPASTDLWLHYCIWKAEHHPEDARSLFIRATSSCGKVYTSNLLWDKYLDFEKSHKNFEAMEEIFNTLLSFPTNKLYEYYTRFKNFIDVQYKDQEDVKRRKKEDIVQAYEKVVIENGKRKNFEQSIKRSNFSTKPLDSEQIQNWRKYLEFEESEGNLDMTKLLYERCIVPCCYYSEFWIRYARFINKVCGVEQARSVYKRANKEFLSKRPDVFVAQGFFEELNGCIEDARRLYIHAYENVAPGLIEGLIKHAHLERRQKEYQKADELFNRALEVSFDYGDSGCVLFVVGEYGRFHLNYIGDIEKSLEIYEKGLEKAADQKGYYYLYLNVLNRVEKQDDRLEKIKKVFEYAVGSESRLTASDQLEIWVSYIDFMKSHWKNYEDIKELEKRYLKVFHHQNILTVDFKSRCGIKRMKRTDAFDFPEPVKTLPK